MSKQASAPQPFPGELLPVGDWQLAVTDRAPQCPPEDAGEALLLTHGRRFNGSVWQHWVDEAAGEDVHTNTLTTLSAGGHRVTAFDMPPGEHFPNSRSEGPALEDPETFYEDLFVALGLERAIGVFHSQSGADLARPILEGQSGVIRRLSGLILIATAENPEPVEQIDVPTLVIWGTADKVRDPANADLVASRFSNVTVAMMDGASHVPMLDSPRDVNQLFGWFSENPGTARDRHEQFMASVTPSKQIVSLH